MCRRTTVDTMFGMVAFDTMTAGKVAIAAHLTCTTW